MREYVRVEVGLTRVNRGRLVMKAGELQTISKNSSALRLKVKVTWSRRCTHSKQDGGWSWGSLAMERRFRSYFRHFRRWSSRTAVSSNSYYRATTERAKEETREESARVTRLKQVPWVAAWASSPTACCCSFACWTLWAWQESIQVQASQDAQLWLWMWSATNAKALLWKRCATEDMDYPIKLNKSRETMPLVTVKSRIRNF